MAAQTGQAAIISALISGGADFEAVDTGGDNALHVAAKEGHLAAARALLADSDIDAAHANLKGTVVSLERYTGPRLKYSARTQRFDGTSAKIQSEKPQSSSVCDSLRYGYNDNVKVAVPKTASWSWSALTPCSLLRSRHGQLCDINVQTDITLTF